MYSFLAEVFALSGHFEFSFMVVSPIWNARYLRYNEFERFECESFVEINLRTWKSSFGELDAVRT